MKIFKNLNIAVCVSAFSAGVTVQAGEAPKASSKVNLFSSTWVLMTMKAKCGNYAWYEMESETCDEKGVVTKKIERNLLVDLRTKKELELTELKEQGDPREAPVTLLISDPLNVEDHRLVLWKTNGLNGIETLYYIRGSRESHYPFNGPSLAKGLCVAPGSLKSAAKPSPAR